MSNETSPGNGIEVDGANWEPLERRIGNRCKEFMWMFRKDGVEYFKHIGTRRYLLLDRNGECLQQTDIGLMPVEFDIAIATVTEVVV
jgi:hypothetical protein